MYIRVQSFQIYWNTETGTKTATKLMYTQLYRYTELLSCCVRAVGRGRDPLTHTSPNPWEGEGPSHTHLSQPMGGRGTLSHTPLPTHGSGRDLLTHLSQPMGGGVFTGALLDNSLTCPTLTPCRTTTGIARWTTHK